MWIIRWRYPTGDNTWYYVENTTGPMDDPWSKIRSRATKLDKTKLECIIREYSWTKDVGKYIDIIMVEGDSSCG
jgi:hypothetical protein